MYIIPEFEGRGVRAVLTDMSDGDCSPDSEAARAALQGVSDHAPVSALVRQVHGTKVVTVGRETAAPWSAAPEADGLVTASPGIVLGIRVADCVPVYLMDDEAGVLGLVHAGRQGTYDGIVTVAVHAMAALGADAERLQAHIGPSAGPCCYEVSLELANQFRDRGLAAKGRYLDLWEANRAQLEWAGLRPDRIGCSSVCTICDGRFHSYRRHRGAARNLALICRV